MRIDSFDKGIRLHYGAGAFFCTLPRCTAVRGRGVACPSLTSRYGRGIDGGVLKYLPLFLCLLPVAAVPPQGTPCRVLVERTAAVERQLLAVSDRESADCAAAALETEFAALQTALRGLAEHPQTEEAAQQELAQTMQRLLYITQRYLPVVQRLEEVNAYGSEALISVLHRYKQSAPRHEEGAVQETPLERAYTDWAEAAEDVLYLLRQVQDEADAAETALTLPLAVEHLQQCRLSVQTLGGSAAATDRRTAAPAAVKTLPRLRAELHTERARLSENRCFGVPALLPMAEQAERAAE